MKAARETNKGKYVLTGRVETPQLDDSYQHDLAAILTIMQQRDVALTKSKAVGTSCPSEARSGFPNELDVIGTRDADGSVLLDDVFAPDAHRTAIDSLLGKLRDNNFCGSTQFRQLLFKVAETYRQRENYLDINYFLLFSGIEAYSKACQTTLSTERDVAKPIAAQLQALGFNIAAENHANPIRAVRTYSTLRNALFHDGTLTAEVKGNHPPVPVNMSDFYLPFKTLVLFATLRAAGIENINLQWDGWVTKQWH
jgi:hypothetical protein